MPGPQPTAEAALHRLLDQHHADSFQLPPLQTEKSRLAELLDRFWSWVQSQFSSGPAENFQFIFVLAKWVAVFAALCLILLVLALLVRGLMWVVRYFRRSHDQARLSRPGLHRDAERSWEQTLQKQIDDARKKRDFARAARLRWRLYLIQRSLPDGCTPIERLGAPAVTVYELMFGSSPSGGAVEAYDAFERILAQTGDAGVQIA
jgi:hypothetical protein